jgi:transposase
MVLGTRHLVLLCLYPSISSRFTDSSQVSWFALGSPETPLGGKDDGAVARPRKYPVELQDRAVRLVLESFEADGSRRGAVARIGGQLGINPEVLRKWVRQAEVDQGITGGLTTKERQRIAELEKELKEVKRANEILKSAAVFFGAELDRQQKR